MALENFRMLINEFLNKDIDIVPEEAPLIFLDSKSSVCKAKNGRDTKQKKHISRRMYLVRDGEKWKMHNNDWCEVGLQLSDIATKNIVDTDSTPKVKFIMV